MPGDAFAQSDQRIINFGFSNSAHWLRFTLQNDTDDEVLLELAQAFLPEADLYYKDSDNQWQSLKAGFEVPISEKPIAHHFQVYPLPGGTTEFYVRFIAYAHPVDVNLWSSSQFEIRSTRQKLIYGLQSGIFIFVILNNIFLFFSLRRRIYIHYAFLTLAYLGVAGYVMEGYFQYLFPKADMIYWYTLIPTITAAAALSYCIAFVETKKYTPGIYRFARIALYFYISYIVWHQFLPSEISIPLNQLMSGVVLFLQGYIAIRAGIKGNRFGYYYAVAYFIYFFIVVLEAVYVQTGSPPHMFELSHVSVASLIEILLLAYALSKRLEWDQKVAERAKTEAQEKLLEKTVENERITQEKNRRLEEVDKIKDQFLANTSHELRTPLNGIIGLSESLQERVNDTDQLEDLDLIVSSSKRLASLVNDLLDFSKLKNLDIVLQTKPVDLHSIVDVVFRVFQPLIVGKELVLINSISPDMKAVIADENRLQQVFHNLVSNAIKFTHNGEVVISAKEVGGMIEISIKDTGIGIPDDKHESIFESFQQADGSISRDYGGTGLGLTITKQLVELHGGKISFFSEVDKGTTFVFTLPATDARGERLSTSQTMSAEIVNEISSVNVSDDYSATTDGSEARILIVDDESINRKVLRNHLNTDFYYLEFASNGKEAIELIENSQPFDLILLDVMMPQLSGYEVCEKIRETYLPSELPVIMVTAKNHVTDLVQGLKVGANDYLTKPFSKHELLARVQTQLDLNRIFKVAGRFVPNEFIKSMGRERITEVHVGDLAKRDVTVLFSDIRDYTSIVESMTPEDNFRLVQGYNIRMGPIITRNNGFINQYLGDAIMAIFPGRIEDAVNAAIEMQTLLGVYNAERIEKNRAALRAGIGLHTGPLVMGVIGDDTRMDVATIADTVNTTSRIESLNKFYNTSILISENSYNSLENPDEYNMRNLGFVRVKGKQNAIGVYECFDGKGPDEILRKKASLAEFQVGLEAYHSKDFESAVSSFEKALKESGQDPTIKMMLDRSAYLLENPVDDDWTGIISMNEK